jgi:hypothetical protein
MSLFSEPPESRPPNAGAGPVAGEERRPGVPQEGVEPRSWWRRVFKG